MRRRGGGGNPDRNQGPLLELAKRLGASVQVVSQVGGWIDVTVGFRGVNLLWEVKREGWRKSVARGKKLTETESKQAELRATWAGRIEIIETADEVIRSLLMADLNRPVDYAEVPNDWLASITRAIRLNPELMKGF